MMKILKVFLLLTLFLAVWGNVHASKKMFVPQINNPQDPSDDTLRTEPLRWDEDDDPLWVVLHRNSAEVILPPAVNLQNISDDKIFMALNRCLERWNNTKLEACPPISSSMIQPSFPIFLQESIPPCQTAPQPWALIAST